MSSLAKANISISKKDLQRSRIPLVASRNVVFYHKASGGELSINLLALSMPSELPTMVQATVAEISGAKLVVNKKNLKLVSSVNDELIQGLHYIVTSGTTIQLIGPYLISGAEVDEIFIGTINSAPVSDLVVASAQSVDKTYTLAVGQNILNLGREYKVGLNINDDIGSIKVFVNGVLAHRDTDYYEIDSGNGYGVTIGFYAAPASIPYQVAVDFGVMSITDNNAIGAIESLSGAVKKIADDLAEVAGTSVTDYYSANPSEIERRTFGDNVLTLMRVLNLEVPIATTGSAFTPTVIYNTGGATNVTWTGFQSRIGNRLIVDIRGTFSAASAAFQVPRFIVPNGLNIDAAKLLIGINGFKIVGTGSSEDQSVQNIPFNVTFPGITTWVQVEIVTNIAPFTFNTNDSISLHYEVPILEWAATQTIRQALGL